MVTVLRPLSTSELLDRTFHLYRNNFLLFVGIVAIPQLFVLAARVALRANADPRHAFAFLFSTLAISIASLAALEISHAATVVAVSNLHLDSPITIGSAFSLARSSFSRAIRIALAVIFIPMLIAIPVAVVLGIVLSLTAHGLGTVAMIRVMSLLIVLAVILVGLRWWLAWSLVIPVTVLEGGGLRVSMRRSKTLTKGIRGRIFVVYLLILILAWVVTAVVQFPLMALFGLRPFRAPAHMSFAAQATTSVGAFLSTSIVGALAAIALTLIYYDQRVRKEGFDLQLMMSRLDPNAAAAAAASSNL